MDSSALSPEETTEKGVIASWAFLEDVFVPVQLRMPIFGVLTSFHGIQDSADREF